MKNLFRAAVCFVILFFAVTFVECLSAADHTHFNTERSKSGVVLSRAYRSNSEACADWVSMDKLTCGEGSQVGYYDSALDGFVIAIVGGLDEANSLRTDFNSITNEIWVQWEMYIDQDFVDDLPITADDGEYWINTKLFRMYNNARLGCSNKNHDTLFIGWKAFDSSKLLDWQDTDLGDCAGAEVELGAFGNKGDKWIRWTYCNNFNTGRVRTWLTTMDGTTTLVADDVRSGIKYGGIDGCGPLLHSTSRDHHPDAVHPKYIFAFRNMIVSTNQIAFGDGSPPLPPDTMLGDVNDDGTVDILDTQACINQILGQNNYGDKADVNDDGSVDISDVQIIINKILE